MNNELLKNEYLTVRDIQTYLNISQGKAYQLAHRKDFPVVRLGSCTRVPRELFLRWVEQHTQIPADLASA